MTAGFLIATEGEPEVLVVARGGSGRYCVVDSFMVWDDHEYGDDWQEHVVDYDEAVRVVHETIEQEFAEGKLRKDWPLSYMKEWAVQF
jgi:hypothetical protein